MEREERPGGEVLLTGQSVKKVEEFQYMRSVFQSNGDNDVDVIHKVKAALTKWRQSSGGGGSFVIGGCPSS